MKVKHTSRDGSTTEIDLTGSATAKATWDGETISTRLVKADAARQYTLDLAYPADKADTSVALDGHRDFASKSAVEDAAWNYMREHRRVGTYHTAYTGEGESDGAAQVVESYIYRGPDWAVKAADGSEVMIKSGDWLMGFVWSDNAWSDVLAGKINGVSVEGTVKRRTPSKTAVEGLRT